jgi:hypothetical protein
MLVVLSLLFFGLYAGALFSAMVLIFCILKKRNLRRRAGEEEEEYRRQLESQRIGTRPPVEPRNLDVLIVQKYEPPPDGDVMSDVALCEICLDEFQAGDIIASSPNKFCIHKFHKDCITPALLVNPTCPCCRRDYLTLTEEDEEEKSVIINDVENQFTTTTTDSIPVQEMGNLNVAEAVDENIVTATTPDEVHERDRLEDGSVFAAVDNNDDPNHVPLRS